MLVRMDTILKKASKENYGVAAPNVFNMETVKAAFEAARELKSPIIIDCAEKHGIEIISEITKYYSRKYPEVVAALNLDHGKNYDAIVKAIRCGFTSVMIDRSQASFEENVLETSEITKMAHAVDVSVEAELGHVGQGVNYSKDREVGLTDPDKAVEFVKKTSVDCLAVAVGTAHGRYIGTPVIDFERLAAIRERVTVPLVLHGGSSSGDENLRKAVKLGISKVNLFTDLSVAGAESVNKYLSNEEYPRFDTLVKESAKGYKEMLIHYMKLFDSVGRA